MMTLNFPNPSRHYDKSRQSIRFSGYDGAFEVLFRVDLDALPVQEKKRRVLGEKDYLSAFDRFRKSIQDVAGLAYSRGRKDIYWLTANDFK